MTNRGFEARLSKVEREIGATALSRMTAEELDDEIRLQLGHILHPFGMDILAARDAFRASDHPVDRQLARQLEALIPSLPELYPEHFKN